MSLGRLVRWIANVGLLSLAFVQAGERERPEPVGAYFLDGDRILIRLRFDREHCEMLGPDGQRLNARLRIEGRELLLSAGPIQRCFAYRFVDGDLMLTPADRDRPDGAHLLGGMPPVVRGEERRYVSLRNWTAKGRPAEPVSPVARPSGAGAPEGTDPFRDESLSAIQRRLAADVPLRVTDERIVLPVTIDETVESRAVLDTGAVSCLLDLSQVELRKPRLGEERKLLFPYIGAVKARDLTLKSLALGSHRLEGFRVAAVRRDAPLGRDAPILLGMELFRNQPFTLDFARQRLLLWMPGSMLPEPAEGLARVKLDLVADPAPGGGRPHIRVPVNGAAETVFLVDTGAPLSFFVRALNPQEQGFVESAPVSRIPAFLGGVFQDLPLRVARYRRIELGSWVLENRIGFLLDMSAQQKRVYSGDLDSLLNLIGTPFLRTLPAVHFDIPNRVLYLDRAAE